MELKVGYKKTDLGPIPEDWEVIPMNQVAQCLIGLTYSPSDVRSFGTLVLRSSNVQNSRLAFDDNVYVEMDIPPRAITQEGDILVCVRNGSRQLIGKSALIDKATAGSAFGAFMAVLRSQSSAFLFQQFQSNILKRQINDGMGATINQITNKDMASFKVIWPKDETERGLIAEALLDTDALIESLEQLLKKKQRLKIGAMQDLLTGKTRLPGFEVNAGYKQTEVGVIPEDWDLMPLLSATRIAQGQVDPKAEPYRSMLLVGPAHVESASGKLFLRQTADEQGAISGKYLFAEGDIVYGKINPYLQKAFLADFKGLCSADMYPLRPQKGISSAFILAVILGRRFTNFAVSVSVRSGMPKINRVEMGEFVLPIPSDKDEQEAIGTVLSNMDTEIASIETKLIKARQIKQGMMQELLTGKIRLV